MHRIAMQAPSSHHLRDHVLPALLAVVLFAAITFGFSSIQHPLLVYNGTISPAVVDSGQKVTLRWAQEWRELCPVTVTRELIGPDGWVHRTLPVEVSPPENKGVRYLERETSFPSIPKGSVQYHAMIEPHCWIDKVWQRRYWTSTIAFNVQ